MSTRNQKADPLKWVPHTLRRSASGPLRAFSNRSSQAMLQPLGATSLESATASTLWLPELPDSPLDKAIRLLQVAAEVEHALMVQYLYAGNAFTTANQMIRDIAVEEMIHLMTV